MASETTGSEPGIEIDAQRMVDGMFEMFDELGDLALNRVVRLTRNLEGGFNPTLITPDNVNRFKITWFTALGELMFREMTGDNVPGAMELFLDEVRYQADQRDETDFLDDIIAEIRSAIDADRAYASEGIFNQPSGNGNGSSKNAGLGPVLARTLADEAFSANTSLSPIYGDVRQTVEDEFINAYGHATISCSKFVVMTDPS